MTMCVSGSHSWLSAVDAAKCCHPDWSRILVVGRGASRSDTALQVEAGTVFGRKWVRREDLERHE